VFHYRSPITDIYLFTDGSTDVIDEALLYFKANVFFRNYEIKVHFLDLNSFRVCRLFVKNHRFSAFLESIWFPNDNKK
jgi:hypothetical protein